MFHQRRRRTALDVARNHLLALRVCFPPPIPPPPMGYHFPRADSGWRQRGRKILFLFLFGPDDEIYVTRNSDTYLLKQS